MTPLHSVLKRAIQIQGQEYVLTLTPDRLKLTAKGKRNGIELVWQQLVSGDAALAVALRASVGAIGSRAALAPVGGAGKARAVREPPARGSTRRAKSRPTRR